MRPNEQHLDIKPSILYFGTPVVLVSTLNADGSPNLAPMSSAWALGWTVVLGLGTDGQTVRNLRARRECVLNLPDPGMWPQVERLAPLTGRPRVPPGKRDRYRTERDKFSAAGLHPQPSVVVGPPRVRECPLQLEAKVVRIRRAGEGTGFFIVETQVEAVHAAGSLVIEGTDHIDPAKWSPLLYVFRHYFGTGRDLGRTFRAEV